jgi:hypothetical protein
MRANREKTSSVMGLVVSVLLHGIFFAGCYALDAASATGTQADPGTTEINTLTDQPAHAKANS